MLVPTLMLGTLTAGYGIVSLGVPHALRLWQERRLAARCRRKRVVVLSYDDGPSAVLTREVLDRLSAHRATASFLLLGRRIVGHEPLVVRMYADGHEVGCHGQDHVNGWKASPWRVFSDVRQGYDALSPWSSSSAIFRPPYGKLSLAALWPVWRHGGRLAWWTIDSGDTHARLPTPQSVADRVARAGGGVVLMHDFDRGPERAQFVLKTTELLLETAHREGLTVCRYSDLLISTASDVDERSVLNHTA